MVLKVLQKVHTGKEHQTWTDNWVVVLGGHGDFCDVQRDTGSSRRNVSTGERLVEVQRT